MQVSTILNTHVLTFRDSEGRADMPISSERAEKLVAFLIDPNKPSHFYLLDDHGNFKETIPRGIIKAVKEIEKNKTTEGMKWSCDFGTRHFMHEQRCICDHHYLWPEKGIGIAFNFLEWCRKRFPKVAPELTSDITDRMREIFLQEKTLILNKK